MATMPKLSLGMPARYAVLLQGQIWFLSRTNIDGIPRVYQAVVDGKGLSDQDLTHILKMAGCRVRYYDEEGKEWVEESIQAGAKVVNGDRDGSWNVPNIEDFEKHYLVD